MLENIAIKPFLGLVKRFKELGLKVSDGYKPIEELAGLKLIIPVTIDGNRLYEITQSGKKSLDKSSPKKAGADLSTPVLCRKNQSALSG